jgi:hypothetical protein
MTGGKKEGIIEYVLGNWANDFGWWHSFSAMFQGHYAIPFLSNA